MREDIADALARVGAFYDDDSKVRFGGWARMALPLTTFKVSVRLAAWLAAAGQPWAGGRLGVWRARLCHLLGDRDWCGALSPSVL